MTLADLLAGALALILASGAGAKLLARDDFALAVEAYELLPERAVPTFARLFPVAELLAALLLLPPVTRAAGAALAALVVLAATAAVAVNLARGRTILDCGCGGLSGRQPISAWLVARNAGLVLLLAAAATPATAAVPIDLAGCLAGALGLAFGYAAADQLLANGLAMRKVPG
jgi:hypothetical protein